MRRITITLQPDERAALIVLAKREKRDPREQAAVILRHEIERCGLLASQGQGTLPRVVAGEDRIKEMERLLARGETILQTIAEVIGGFTRLCRPLPALLRRLSNDASKRSDYFDNAGQDAHAAQCRYDDKMARKIADALDEYMLTQDTSPPRASTEELCQP